MGWTKRQLIEAAYRKIGLANYVFDLDPQQLQDACNDMDALVGSWENVNIGYTFADSPSSANIDVDSGVPSYANAAIYLNLAISLANDMGKNISQVLIGQAKKAYMAMVNAALPANLEYQMPSQLPRGAGQKPWRDGWGPFMPMPTDALETGPDGDLELLN